MRKISLLAVVILVIQCFGTTPVATAASCSWPCFMGDIGHTGYAQTGCGPQVQNSSLAKIWEYKISGSIMTSVVVDGNYAFFGSTDNRFYCLDAKKGTKIWDYYIGESCKNSKGETIAGSISTPAIYNGNVYFGTICGKIVCLNEKTGSKVWIYEHSYRGNSFNTPLVINNGKIFTTSDEWIYCIDANNGTLKWDEICLDNSSSVPALGDNKVFVACMYWMSCYDENFGRELLDHKFYFEGEKIYFSTPAYKDGKVYFGSLDSNIFRFDANTGEKDWESNFGCISSICITNDSVFFGDYLKNIVCLSESNGSKKWSYEADDYIFGGPISSENKIYVGTLSGDLYCFTTTGSKIWSYKFSDGISAPPSVCNGLLYATSKDGTVACFGDNSQSKPVKITVEADTTNLQPGDTVQCKATAFNKNNEVVDCPIDWSIEPSHLGTVTQNGTFTAGQSSGKVVIKACSGNICGKLDITIKSLADSVSRVEISQPSSSYLLGIDYQFNATAYDIRDTVVAGVKVFWSVEPSEYGFIDPQGLFMPKKEGECTIVAKIGQVIARQKIVVTKIAAIELKPDKATVAPKTKTRFVAIVYDNQGKVIQDATLTWSVEPYYIGSIDNYGTFTAAADSAGQTGLVIVEGYGIKKTADISIVENKKPQLNVDKTKLDFGTIDPGQSQAMIISINNSGNATDTITISSGSNWFKYSPDTKDIEPGGKLDISVELVSEQMTRNSKLEGILSISSAGGFQTSIIVKVSVSDKAPICFETRPQEIYCGKVARGKTVTMPLQIKILSKTPVSGTIKTEQSWIAISPSTFVNTTGTVDVQITVSGSNIPSVTDFEGTITIASNQDCQPISVKVAGSTDKEIRIQLTLNNKIGKINDNDIELDVPPQKIKGRTLVPIRFLSEAFGCSIKWDTKEGKITITKGSFEIILLKDKNTALVNGVAKTLDVPPTIIAGRTLVPLRFIAEAFGATVNYDSKTQGITILWTP